MIDLSFLTEEEQETILTVLKRDAELKKAEEKRVQNLQRTVTNKSQLRYLTGEWFYETKQRRHQDRIHGSDIIRASMKQSQKPLTILELTHILPARPSFVSSEHKDVFVPSVLCGILEDPEEQPSRDRNQIHSNCETQHNTHKTALQSPVKMRKNPFNTDFTPEERKTHDAESRLSPNSLISMDADPKENVGISEKVISISSQETFANVKGSSPVDQMAVSKNGSSSATQLPFSPVDPQSPANLATETWAGSKKVTLRSDSQIPVAWKDGKELREHHLMDVKPSPPCKEQNSSDLGNIRSTSTGTHKLFYRQSPENLQEGGENETSFQENQADQHQVSGDASEKYEFDPINPTVSRFVLVTEEPCKLVDLEKEPKKDCRSQAQAKDWSEEHNIYYNKTNPDIKSSPTEIAKSVSQDFLPKYEQQMLGFFTGEKEKTTQVKIPPKKEVKMSKQNINEESYSKDPLDMSDKKEIKPTHMTKVRSLQLAALQKTPFKETMMPLGSDTKQEDRSVGQASQCLNRSSHLKAFSENEQKVFNLRTGEKEKHEDPTETVMEIFDYSQTNPPTPPQTDFNKLLNVSKDYGIYRANFVLIHEETDDLLTGLGTGLQITESQENKVSPEPHLEFHPQKQECYIPVSPLTQSSLAPEEKSFTKTDDLRHFWEKENTAPKVITTREKKTPSKSVSHNNKASLQSDPRISAENRERSEGEAQMIQYKPSSNTINSLKETDKDFVQPDSSKLKSFDSTVDVEPPCNQDHIETDTESDEKTFSHKTFQPPRLKDKDNEARRSPSKTYHPKVLPLESSSAKRSWLDGSPLKTFPIDIDPKTKEQQEGPDLDSRQKKSPSHIPKQIVRTDNNLGEKATSSHPPLSLQSVHRKTCFGPADMQRSSNTLTLQQSEQASESTLEIKALLARTFIPKDLQYYLGPQEKAHSPPFHQNKAAASADSDTAHRPQEDHREFQKNQRYHTTEEKSWIVQKKVGNSSPETTTGMSSLSQENSGSEL